MNYDVQSLGDESNALTQAESEPTTTTAQSRTRKSWVWQHMDGGPEIVLQAGATTFWRCKYCFSKYKINGGTRVIAQHLKSRHAKTDITIDASLIGVGQQIELAFARSVLNTHSCFRSSNEVGIFYKAMARLDCKGKAGYVNVLE